MRSGGNNFNYSFENKLTKLANSVKFCTVYLYTYVLSVRLGGLGALAPFGYIYATAKNLPGRFYCWCARLRLLL